MTTSTINIQTDFDAKGNNTEDDSTAISNAISYAASLSYTPAIYFPPGYYRFNSVDIPSGVHLLFYTDALGSVRFIYNGAGGAGSYMIKHDNVVSGALPWGGFRNIIFDGYNADLGTVCVDGLEFSSGIPQVRIDTGFEMDRLSFRHFVNAVKLGGIVQLNMTNISYYSIGQYGVYIKGDPSSERRPVNIKGGTWDCGSDTGAADTAVRAASGILDPSTMGYGFMYLGDASGLHIKIDGFRFEGNGPMDSSIGAPCWFRVNSTDSNLATVSFDNTHGYFYGDQSGIPVNVESGTRIGVHSRNSILGNCRTLHIYSSGSGKVALPYNVEEDVHWNADPRQCRGVAVGDGAYEYRSIPSGSDPNSYITFHLRKPGNIIYNADWNSDDDIKGWIAKGEGYARQNADDLISGVSLLATATTVVCSAAELKNLMIGLAIIIPGAGVAGADLETVITDIDYDTRTVTFNDAVVTGVGPITITNNPHQWKAFYAKGSP